MSSPYDLAVAVAGAKRQDGSFVLGSRARRSCTCGRRIVPGQPHDYTKPGSCPGWLPAFLLPPEPCPGNLGRPGTPCVGVDEDGGYEHTLCGGSGQVQRVDVGPLLSLLRDAGYRAAVDEKGISYVGFSEYPGHKLLGPGTFPSLLEAAAQALGVAVRP